MKKNHFLILIIITVALALRLFQLGNESLWFDEAYTHYFVSGPLSRALQSEATNPPLYYTLLHFWIQIAGADEWGLRSLSVIPSILAVFLTFLLGKRLYSEQVGLLAAGYMAISTFQIDFAQEARGFALVCFLLLASMLSLENALAAQTAKRRIFWIAYICSTILALYTHFYSIFFVVAQNVYVLLRNLKNPKGLISWGCIQLFVVFCFSPWLITMINHASSEGGQVRRYLFLKLPQAVFAFFVGNTLVPMDEAAVQNIWGTFFDFMPHAIAAALIFILVVKLALQVTRGLSSRFLFLSSMFFIPILLPFVISFKIPIFDERYLIGVAPILYIFLSSGLVRPFAKFKSASQLERIAGLGMVVLLGISLYNYYFHPRFGREEWRESAGYVDARADMTTDVIVFDGGPNSMPFNYYSKTKVHRISLPNVGGIRAQTIWKDLQRELLPYSRIWLVYSRNVDNVYYTEILRDFEVVSQTKFKKDKGIEIIEFIRR